MSLSQESLNSLDTVAFADTFVDLDDHDIFLFPTSKAITTELDLWKPLTFRETKSREETDVNPRYDLEAFHVQPVNDISRSEDAVYSAMVNSVVDLQQRSPIQTIAFPTDPLGLLGIMLQESSVLPTNASMGGSLSLHPEIPSSDSTFVANGITESRRKTRYIIGFKALTSQEGPGSIGKNLRKAIMISEGMGLCDVFNVGTEKAR